MIEEYGDDDFCLSLVETFIRDGTRALEHLRSSVESGATVKAHAAAHSLKNMLGVLRSQKGMELAEQVCAQLRAESPDPTIQELTSLTARLIEDCRALVATSRTA